MLIYLIQLIQVSVVCKHRTLSFSLYCIWIKIEKSILIHMPIKLQYYKTLKNTSFCQSLLVTPWNLYSYKKCSSVLVHWKASPFTIERIAETPPLMWNSQLSNKWVYAPLSWWIEHLLQVDFSLNFLHNSSLQEDLNWSQ